MKEIEARTRWLRPDKIDPTFGIKGDTKEVLIRRSYRRLESSALFNPVKEAHLDELSTEDKAVAGRFEPKRYVLVEESRLAELAALETILRDEKHRMGEQCAWIMNDYHVDARIPLPATKIAVHNLATADATRNVIEITNLHVAWHDYCIKKNYDRMDDVLNRQSYLKSAPLALRAMKLHKLNETRALKQLSYDRDSMMFEDDLSYLNQSHYRALERKLDYDRYFVLATRYGHMSEELYAYDERPGRRYWLRVQDAVVKFQQVWGLYWAIQRIKRRKGAMQMQKIARCWIYYRRFHPLIIFRMKYGKRTYYEFCLSRWKSYVRICLMCKGAFEFYLDRTWFHNCWYAWKKFAVETREERNKMLRRVLFGIINAGLFKTFHALKHNAIRNRYVKIKMRRLIGFPHFDMWCDYVEAEKLDKKLNNAATMMCKRSRLFMARRRFMAKKRIGIVLGAIIRSVVKCIIIRKAVLQENFMLWEMQETQSLDINKNHEEKNRKKRLQKAMEAREKQHVIDLKRHLKSKHGRIQCAIQLATAQVPTTQKDINRQLIAECAALHRDREKHDFYINDKPMHKCVDPDCGATFISLDQYRNHWRNDIRHANNNRITEKNQFYGENAVAMKNSRDPDKMRKYAYPAPLVTFSDETVYDSKNHKQASVMNIVNFHCMVLNAELRRTMRKSLTRDMFAYVPPLTDVTSSNAGDDMRPIGMSSEASAVTKPSGPGGGGVGGWFATPKIAPTETYAVIQMTELNEREVAVDDGIDKAMSHFEKRERKNSSSLAEEENYEVGDIFNNDDNHSLGAESLLSLNTIDTSNGDLSNTDPVKRNVRNALDLYDAIEEWRHCASTSKEYNSIAIHILDHFLKAPPPVPVREPNEHDLEDYWENYDLDGYNTDDSDDTVLHEEKEEKRRNIEDYRNEQLRKQEIAMRGETVVRLPHEDDEWWNGLISRLESVKYSEHKGHFVQERLPRTCIRLFLGIEGQAYNRWNTEAILPANIFDRLQWISFRFLFHYYNEKYEGFPQSKEFFDFHDIEEKWEERRIQEMYWRAKDVRLQNIEKWVHNVFMDKHLALYRMGENCAKQASENIIDALLDQALDVLVGNRVLDLSYKHQSHHEITNCLAHETYEETFDLLLDELFHFYGNATVESLMSIDQYRHKMMVFGGMREKTFSQEKKHLINVDMTASSASLLDMLGGDDDGDGDGDDEAKGNTVEEEVEEPEKVSITRGRQMPGSVKNPGLPPKPSAEAIEEMKSQAEGEKRGKEEQKGNDSPTRNVINPRRILPGSVPGDKNFHLSPHEVKALQKLQNMGRRIIGRNKARRIFTKTYVKKFDSQYGAVFYANVRDGSSSWETPKIYKTLYPGKTW